MLTEPTGAVVGVPVAVGNEVFVDAGIGVGVAVPDAPQLELAAAVLLFRLLSAPG